MLRLGKPGVLSELLEYHPPALTGLAKRSVFKRRTHVRSQIAGDIRYRPLDKNSEGGSSQIVLDGGHVSHYSSDTRGKEELQFTPNVIPNRGRSPSVRNLWLQSSQLARVGADAFHGPVGPFSLGLLIYSVNCERNEAIQSRIRRL
jgi:hypothetical protein